MQDDGMYTDRALSYSQTKGKYYLRSAVKQNQEQDHYQTEPSSVLTTTEAVRVPQPLITPDVVGKNKATDRALPYSQTKGKYYLHSAAEQNQEQDHFQTESSSALTTTEAVRVTQPLNTRPDVVGNSRAESTDFTYSLIGEEQVPYNSKSMDRKDIALPKLYVFSLSYMDQMSWATTRWRSLQCWAGKLSQQYDVHIVEPFVTKGTHLGVPQTLVSNHSLREVLKLSDIFDVSPWQRNASRGSFPNNIVSWDAFLSAGARSVITVQIVYPYHHDCTENEQTDETCNNDRMRNLFSQHLAMDNFTLLKTICINFREVDHLTTEQFDGMIFESLPKDLPVTVMFDEWRGLGKKSCIARVKDKNCYVYNKHFVRATLNLITPSSRIKSAAQKYIDRYLPGQSGFIAIMIRWEKILLYDFYSYHNKSQHYSGSSCQERILKYINNTTMHKKRPMKDYFLSTDIGMYGSSTFRMYNSTKVSTSTLTNYTQELLRVLHKNDSLHLTDYEQTFEDVSGTTHPAFISQLQKVVAARAHCLLLVGWGSFLTNTLDMYKRLHRGKACYKHIKLC